MTKLMIDRLHREREREWESDPETETEVRHLLERRRSGKLQEGLLRVASLLGYAPARLALGQMLSSRLDAFQYYENDLMASYPSEPGNLSVMNWWRQELEKVGGLRTGVEALLCLLEETVAQARTLTSEEREIAVMFLSFISGVLSAPESRQKEFLPGLDSYRSVFGGLQHSSQHHVFSAFFHLVLSVTALLEHMVIPDSGHPLDRAMTEVSDVWPEFTWLEPYERSDMALVELMRERLPERILYGRGYRYLRPLEEVLLEVDLIRRAWFPFERPLESHQERIHEIFAAFRSLYLPTLESLDHGWPQDQDEQ